PLLPYAYMLLEISAKRLKGTGIVLMHLEKLTNERSRFVELRMKQNVGWTGSTLAPGLKLQLPTTGRIADIKALNPQGADFRQFGLQHHFHIGIASDTLQAHHQRR